MKNWIEDIVAEPNSQSIVARELGVSPQAVQKWTKLGYVPLARALQLEDLYGVPAIDMVSPKQRGLLLQMVGSKD